MTPLICKNDLESVCNELQDYLKEGRKLGGLRLVDSSPKQVVILLDDQPINQATADVWWSGYQAALG